MKAMMLLCTAALLPAQGIDQKARQVVDQAIAALGGDAFLKVQDRVEEGRAYSFYNDRLTGLSRTTIYTRYTTTPDSISEIGQRERQAFGKKEESAVLLAGDEAWDVTFRGARPLPKASHDRWRESTLNNVFYILMKRLDEKGFSYEWRGSDVVDNQPVNKVEFFDRDNRSVLVFFHSSTHLPVRQVWVRRDPAQHRQIEEITIFTKYRDVGGGVKWPFAIRRERDGEKVFEMFAESVRVNQDLTDNLFLLPGDIKRLPPAR
jgi:hypothetical protein